MANSSYITELKRLIKSEIINDKDIVTAFGSPDLDMSDMDFSANDVAENYIFTWNQNPSVMTETITFLTLMVHISKYDKTWVKPTVEIWIYSHNNHMKLDSKLFPGIIANRNDFLSQLLDDKFNGRSQLGNDKEQNKINLLGQLTLTSNTEGVYNDKFVYRRLIFETLDLNDSVCDRW